MARPIYRRRRMPPALILDAAACSKAIHPNVVTTTTTPPTPTEVPEMAAKKSAAKAKPPAKSKAPAAPKPSRAAVNQVAADVLARLDAQAPHADLPPGVTAATASGVGDALRKYFKRAVPVVAEHFLELAMMAGDGTVSPAEMARIVAIAYESFRRIMAPDAPAAGSPTA